MNERTNEPMDGWMYWRAKEKVRRKMSEHERATKNKNNINWNKKKLQIERRNSSHWLTWKKLYYDSKRRNRCARLTVCVGWSLLFFILILRTKLEKRAAHISFSISHWIPWYKPVCRKIQDGHTDDEGGAEWNNCHFKEREKENRTCMHAERRLSEIAREREREK